MCDGVVYTVAAAHNAFPRDSNEWFKLDVRQYCNMGDISKDTPGFLAEIWASLAAIRPIRFNRKRTSTIVFDASPSVEH